MKNIPSIRFKEFNKEWEESDFSEVFNMNISKNALSRDKLTYNKKMVKNIHYGDIHKKFGNILDSSDSHIPYILDEEFKISKNSVLSDGDIIFTDAAEDMTVGKCVELDLSDSDKVVAGLHTIPARPIRSGKYFYGYYLNSDKYHNKLIPLIEGIKVSSISKSKLNSTKVIYPELEEQTRIGALFKNIDSLIENQSLKVENLKTFKKSMLQKMFPKDGESVPEIRFKGFSGDWEESYYSEYLEIPKKELSIPMNYRDIISVKLHTRGVVSNTNDNLSLGSTNYYKRYKNQLIYGKQNIFYGALGLVPDDLDGKVSSGDIPSLNIINLDELYLFYNMSRPIYYSRLVEISSGTGSKRVHEKELLKQKFIHPVDKEEQEKIGQFFKNLDSKIDCEESLLDLYKNFKKSLLQKMFI